ncbi:MAG TPA: fibronectin type III domain-containing protein [Candidatus Binatia bacterium]|jgi:hypothetical protein|nr:fibronectin type III domain-containing protein [Candidatus Binatia bacterium]
MRLAIALGALLIGAGSAIAVPPAPPTFYAIPVYVTPPAITIVWREPTGATYFTLYRKNGTDPELVLYALAATTPGQRTTFVDSAVAPRTTYTYRIEACDSTGCASAPSFATAVSTVWPISGGRRVIQGFNENLAWAGIRGDDGMSAAFHDGVDLGRTTTGTTPADDVLAPRGGVVTQVVIPPPPSQDDGFIEIAVSVGGGKVELDGFNHISTAMPPTLMIGDAVAPGQRIAAIGTRNFDRSPTVQTAFDDHVHYQLGAVGSARTTIRHPLSVFMDDADRDPLGNLPGLNDENGDGKAVLYRDHTSGNIVDYDLATKPLHGDLDVAVEVTDRQGTKPEEAPVRLGYWIEGPLPAAEQLDDVKSAEHPYRLYDFRTEYWGLEPKTPCNVISAIEDAANYGCLGVKAAGCLGDVPACTGSPNTSPFKEPGTGIGWMWPILHHFVVTHAGGEGAERTGLSNTQFWRTAAKDDGAAVVSLHANYAGEPATAKAWEARFPDGDYTVHVLASDLVHQDVDLRLLPTRLENFAPFVREILVTVDTDGNPSSGRADTPGCEDEIYSYRHPARKPYPDPFTLAVARSAAGAVPIRASVPVCVRIRFSEPMNDAVVDLVRVRGAGSTLATATLTPTKAFQDKDTWVGKVTLAADPSGNSDSDLATDQKDVAVRVTAHDRRDAGNAVRALDADGDGVNDASGDINHLVKIDLSPMKKTVTVIK